ncbi:hypothetical protein EBU99_09715 [bacterium]|nr:hypothetical protein [bacterium]
MKKTSRKIRPKISSMNRALWILACASTPAAFAQRGSDYVSHRPISETPSSGIPGFFDTETASAGSLVFDVPSLSIDYGISEHLTLGTNAVAVLSTSLWLANGGKSATPIVMLKARYRIFSQEGWTSSVTGYGGGARLQAGQINSLESRNILVTYALGTINFVKQFDSQSLGLSLLHIHYGTTSGQATSDPSAQEIRRLTSVISVWARQSFLASFEGEALVAFCADSSGYDNRATVRIEINEACFGPSKTAPALRGLLSWRSSPEWYWSIGAVWQPAGTMPPLPYLGFNYLTQLRQPENREKE